MAKVIYLFLIIWILTMILPVSASQGNWEIVKEAGGIEVRRLISQGSPTGEFQAVCNTNSRIEVIGMVMADIPGQTDWVEYLEESRIIKKISEDHFVIHQHYDFIWPLYDRDCVAEVTIQRDYERGRARAIIKGVAWDDIPRRKRTVRVARWDSEIILSCLSRNRTRIVYNGAYDLGGTMPDWLAAILSREIPYRYLNQLVREASKEKHKRAAKGSEHEKRIEDAIMQGKLKF